MCFHSQHSRVDLRQKAAMHEAVVEEMGDKTLVVNYYTYQECTARWKTVQEWRHAKYAQLQKLQTSVKP